MTPLHTIGQLAREADVPTSTIRYYERRGLLTPSGRSSGNYRVYDDNALERLRFVRSAQAAGFTLSDITSLLELQNEASPCQDVQDLIATRLDQVVDQAKHLKIVDRMLRQWLKVCHEAEQSGRCGVLDGLQASKNKKVVKSRECP